MENLIDDNIKSIFKIVLIGSSAVGKTNIMTKYINNKFELNNSPTVGVDFSNFEYKKDDKIYKLQIWDTAGQERFKEFAKSYFKGTQGILLVYDITCKQSFLNLNQWILKIKENLSMEEIKIILIGNKIDLNEKRQVKTEEGINFAKENDFLFIETSCLTNENNCIQNAFSQLINELIINFDESSYFDCSLSNKTKKENKKIIEEKKKCC